MVEITLSILLQVVQTVALLVGIVYYLTIMRNSQKTQQMQLETRQTQLFMEIFDKAQSKAFVDAYEWWKSAEFEGIDDFLKLMHADTHEARVNLKRFSVIGTYYEGVGVLVKEGRLDIRWVALLMAGMVRDMWEKLEPVIEAYRAHTRERMASESEYLYNELMKYLEEHPELKT